MRILVMGGTRFNGLALVRELVKHGHEVTIFNRGQTEANLPGGVRRLFGDRYDPDSVRTALEHETFDCVQDMTAYAVEDVKTMADLFRGRVGHYIFASSAGVYAASKIFPITEDFPVDVSERQIAYGRQKVECEEFLVKEFRASGFPATIVRFGSVFGPNNFVLDREQRMFVRMLQRRPVLIPGDGTTLAQIGHVDDEARALRMLMLVPASYGKIFNLTGRQYFTDEGYVDVIAEVIGVTPEKHFVPPAIMDDLWAGRIDLGETLAEDRGSQGAGRIVRLAQLAPRGTVYWWNQSGVFSIDRIRSVIDWEPSYTFRSAVEHTYDWFKSEGRDTSLTFDFSLDDQLLELLRSHRRL